MKKLFVVLFAISSLTAFSQSGTKYATGGNTLGPTDKLGSNNNAPMRLVTNGIERARFTETGLFGLGTDSPTATFDLSGSFRYRNGSQQSYVLTSDANGNATWQQVPFSSHWAQTGNNIHYMLGNVGIGTTTPSVNLDVVGDVAISNTLKVGTTSVFLGTSFNGTDNNLWTTSGPLWIQNGNNENVIIAADGSTGNVGIGTASPTASFDLSGTFRYRNGSQQSYVLTSDANGNATWQQVSFSSHWTPSGNNLHTHWALSA